MAKEPKPRPIDEEKSERQLKGLDGDALAEEDSPTGGKSEAYKAIEAEETEG